jgi:hypothetical protein
LKKTAAELLIELVCAYLVCAAQDCSSEPFIIVMQIFFFIVSLLQKLVDRESTELKRCFVEALAVKSRLTRSLILHTMAARQLHV